MCKFQSCNLLSPNISRIPSVVQKVFSGVGACVASMHAANRRCCISRRPTENQFTSTSRPFKIHRDIYTKTHQKCSKTQHKWFIFYFFIFIPFYFPSKCVWSVCNSVRTNCDRENNQKFGNVRAEGPFSVNISLNMSNVAKAAILSEPNLEVIAGNKWLCFGGCFVEDSLQNDVLPGRLQHLQGWRWPWGLDFVSTPSPWVETWRSRG